MKHLMLFILFLAGLTSVSLAQNTKLTLNPDPGYITINEINAGIGLGVTNTPYSKGFIGFTTIHGYQAGKDFLVGGGTGISFYNEGILVPLFLDFRYRFYVSRFTPYAFGDGGVLIDFSDKKDSRIFVTPGIGLSYTISKNLAVDAGAGLLTQWGDLRDGYVNMKAGIVYKF